MTPCRGSKAFVHNIGHRQTPGAVWKHTHADGYRTCLSTEFASLRCFHRSKPSILDYPTVAYILLHDTTLLLRRPDASRTVPSLNRAGSVSCSPLTPSGTLSASSHPGRGTMPRFRGFVCSIGHRCMVGGLLNIVCARRLAAEVIAGTGAPRNHLG